MVYPSGFARIARVEPVVPPAPATFSMTICWPSVRDMCSLTMRAVTSVPPPAGNGTIMVIGRDGNGWADAASTPDTVATNGIVEKNFFMLPRLNPIMFFLRCPPAIVVRAVSKIQREFARPAGGSRHESYTSLLGFRKGTPWPVVDEAA